MDKATIIGLVGAFAIVGAAIVIGGSPVIFVNVPSALIVILGALFVVCMKYSFEKMGNALKVAGKAFKVKLDTPESIIAECVHLSNIVRKDGPLGLESVVIENNFLSRGVRLLVDGTEADIVKIIMEREKDAVIERHDEGKAIFMAVNEVAPAMGMIGTLVGLVQMLSNMNDPKQIGPAMAVALLTTLYGAILSNMVAKPIADKLALRSEEEDLLNSLAVEGVYAMAKGYNAMVIEETLLSSINRKRREKFGDDKESLIAEKKEKAKAA